VSRTLEAMAAELILAAEARGVRIDLPYATSYIAARRTLQTQPNDADALATVKHFESLMSIFGRFTLAPEDYEKHCDGMDKQLENS